MSECTGCPPGNPHPNHGHIQEMIELGGAHECASDCPVEPNEAANHKKWCASLISDWGAKCDCFAYVEAGHWHTATGHVTEGEQLAWRAQGGPSLKHRPGCGGCACT